VREIVEYIVNQLVTDKTAVTVTEQEEDQNTIVIKVSVSNDDMGRVIGKGGKIANSIRSIIKTASSNTDKKYFVKIGEREA
jgi:predicted RNA-binding protein YlqC (UPF0109 family)